MYSIIKLEPQIHIKTLHILTKYINIYIYIYIYIYFNISFNAILIYPLYFNINQVQIYYFLKPKFPAPKNAWSLLFNFI